MVNQINDPKQEIRDLLSSIAKVESQIKLIQKKKSKLKNAKKKT
jgi:hypothetical protein